MSFNFFAQQTPRGFGLGDCTSAFQKSIRRCDVDSALTWACEIDQSGNGQYLWNRILVIMSEDIGPAEPHLPATIRALYETWKEVKSKNKDSRPERLQTIHAVYLLATAKKCRVIDDAIWATYGQEVPLVTDIPDYAYDMHTSKGRAMGRGADHFMAEAALLNNKADIENPYEAIVTAGYSEEWFNIQGGKGKQMPGRSDKHRKILQDASPQCSLDV